jgi:alginate O-acetyltransferase complex protein AlgJ
MKKFFSLILFTVLAAIPTRSAEPAEVAGEELAKIPAGTIAMRTPDGWFFSRNEWEHLSKGPLAQGGIVKVSAAKRNADPLPALAKFHEDLKARGITLICVPVPPKSALVPVAGLQKGDAMKYLKPYYEELRAKGIRVLDLSDAFLASGRGDLYCRTDAHWSPAGLALAADELAKTIELKGTTQLKAVPEKKTVSGDLAVSFDPANPERETVELQTVSGAIDENSPVLLIGDSHTLVFSTGGDMLADNAGLAEALALRLGMGVDRIGVKGSAASAVRINLFRKAVKDPAWLKNKKYVIYCFTCREFTESSGGWPVVPVAK